MPRRVDETRALEGCSSNPGRLAREHIGGPKDELPRASRVLATLRELIGVTGVIQMKDYGHGLGAVHVTLPTLATLAANTLSFSEDWQYVGREIDDDDTDEIAPCMEFSRWVRLDAV